MSKIFALPTRTLYDRIRRCVTFNLYTIPRRRKTSLTMNSKPLVAVVMGSQSDWETMRHAVALLDQFEIANEYRVVSAHRTPELMAQFAAEAVGRGLQIIIAGAGGAAHLPGMIAAQTPLPVLGVPVGTLAIGAAGAKNAAILAAEILALHDEKIRAALAAFRKTQTENALASKLEK